MNRNDLAVLMPLLPAQGYGSCVDASPTGSSLRSLLLGLAALGLVSACASGPPEEVAAVIMQAVDTRAPDLYTRPGQKAQIQGYLDALASDPAPVDATRSP